MRFPYKGSGIVLFNSNKVLIGKRSKSPFKGFYSIPGGGFEKLKDKDDSDCAIRELNEETSLKLEELDAEFCGTFSLKFPFFSWKSFFYKLNDEIPEVFPDEFEDLKFVDFKDLKMYKLRPFSKIEILKAKKSCEL